MSYRTWFENHGKKHREILEKLEGLSKEEIIDYFAYDNLKVKEPGFCPLFAKNQKCHDMEDLNCYFCGCPNFRFYKDESWCAIDSKDGEQKRGKKGNLYQDCSGCIVPHQKGFIEKNFTKSWREAMKNVPVKKLYMISLGAGDYELVTIKALKALESSDIICVPTKNKEGSFDKSLTYKIVKDLMEEFGFSKEIVPVYAPMQFKEKDWEHQVDVILHSFDKSDRVSFVTLGDAAIYSTVYYLLERIKNKDEGIYQNSEVIAGITSFSSASAKVKKPLCLGESGLEIVPMVAPSAPKTTIYMRPSKGMNTADLEERGEFYTFENLNFKEEEITKGKKSRLERYMTLLIDFVKVKK